MASLLAALAARGVASRHVELHEGRAELPGDVGDAPGLLVVDGFEQLGFWRRWGLRRRAGGLLVTTHHCAGLPTLWRTAVTQETTARILEALLRGQRRLVGEEDLRERLRCRRGNLREALFDLYDLHERRRKSERPA